MKYLSAIMTEVRQMLRDEFTSGVTLEWTDDELEIHIERCLNELSKSSPYQVKHTLMTVASSKELDIGSISDVRMLTFVSSGYTDCVADDLDDTVTGDSTSDTGTLLAYDNTRRQWWVRMDATTDEFDEAETVDAADTGTGTTSGASVLGFDPDGLIYVDTVEYKVDRTNKTFRNFDIWGDVLTIDTSINPTVDERVFLYCAKLHELTKSSSTLKARQEMLLVDGVCAYAAIAKAREHINKVNIGGGRTASEFLSWGHLKLAQYKLELKGIAKRKVFREYPKG